MAATVNLYEKNGAGQTATLTASTGGGGPGTVRYKKADNATYDAVNPLVKPASGNSERSYEKWLRLNISVAPTGVISAPKFYTDGGNNFGTGISAYIRTTNPGSYSTPAVPANDSGGTDQFTYSSGGTQKALNVANTEPGGTGWSATGDFADYAVLWMTLASTVSAPQNPTAVETIYFAWQET